MKQCHFGQRWISTRPVLPHQSSKTSLLINPYAHFLRYDGTSDLATVESYDPITNSWQPEVSMGTRRSCLGVAVLHGLLYAAGGYDGASCLNRCEHFLVTNAKHRDLLHSLKKCSLVSVFCGLDAVFGVIIMIVFLFQCRALRPADQHMDLNCCHEHPKEICPSSNSG